MTRVALCFPGQGSQVPGMAAGLLDLPEATPLLERAAGDGLDLRAAFDGDADALRPTEVAQPALLLVECVLRALLPSDADVVAVAGHSVGEYAALVAAGALDGADAMSLVVARGRAMAAMRDGGMLALLGADDETAERLCEEVRSRGEVIVVANRNAPGQVVVSGSLAAVDAAAELAPGLGIRRATRLNVSGAFHSPLMHDAAERFGALLDSADLRDARVPVVCNVDAEAVRDADGLRARLRRQLESQVRWSDCVRRLVAECAEVLVEVGPQSVLTGLARRIAPEVRAVSVATAEAARSLGAVAEVATGG